MTLIPLDAKASDPKMAPARYVGLLALIAASLLPILTCVVSLLLYIRSLKPGGTHSNPQPCRIIMSIEVRVL